jgi:hypothetical protein
MKLERKKEIPRSSAQKRNPPLPILKYQEPENGPRRITTTQGAASIARGDKKSI